MPVTVTDLTFLDVEGGSAGLTGVLAVPDGNGPWPGVVMVHEAYGINDVMRRQVVRIAGSIWRSVTRAIVGVDFHGRPKA